jgi:hypothetical protein
MPKTRKTIHKVKCVRCLHSWLPMVNRRPRVCPRCKSYDWDKPYVDSGTRVVVS